MRKGVVLALCTLPWGLACGVIAGLDVSYVAAGADGAAAESSTDAPVDAGYGAGDVAQPDVGIGVDAASCNGALSCHGACLAADDCSTCTGATTQCNQTCVSDCRAECPGNVLTCAECSFAGTVTRTWCGPQTNSCAGNVTRCPCGLTEPCPLGNQVCLGEVCTPCGAGDTQGLPCGPTGDTRCQADFAVCK